MMSDACHDAIVYQLCKVFIGVTLVEILPIKIFVNHYNF